MSSSTHCDAAQLVTLLETVIVDSDWKDSDVKNAILDSYITGDQLLNMVLTLGNRALLTAPPPTEDEVAALELLLTCTGCDCDKKVLHQLIAYVRKLHWHVHPRAAPPAALIRAAPQGTAAVRVTNQTYLFHDDIDDVVYWLISVYIAFIR